MENRNKNLINLGNNLRKIRNGIGLSQQELADNSNIAKSTIQRIENGSLNPTFLILLTICNSLNIEINQLVNLNSNEYVNDLLETKKQTISTKIFRLEGNFVYQKIQIILNSRIDINNVEIIVKIYARSIYTPIFETNLCDLKKVLINTEYSLLEIVLNENMFLEEVHLETDKNIDLNLIHLQLIPV